MNLLKNNFSLALPLVFALGCSDSTDEGIGESCESSSTIILSPALTELGEYEFTLEVDDVQDAKDSSWSESPLTCLANIAEDKSSATLCAQGQVSVILDAYGPPKREGDNVSTPDPTNILGLRWEGHTESAQLKITKDGETILHIPLTFNLQNDTCGAKSAQVELSWADTNGTGGAGGDKD